MDALSLTMNKHNGGGLIKIINGHISWFKDYFCTCLVMALIIASWCLFYEMK